MQRREMEYGKVEIIQETKKNEGKKRRINEREINRLIELRNEMENK